MSSPWGTPICPRCQKPVYMAEQIIGPTGPWHKACLTCADCKKRLDSYILAEHEGEAYCKTCHGRQFGPKGYGFAAGSAFLSTDKPSPLKTGSLPSPLKNGDPNSPKPLTDVITRSPPMSPTQSVSGIFSSRPQSPKSGTARKWTMPATGDKCPRCEKTVFAAEAVLGAGKKYHRLCLRCSTCSKMLDSTNMTDRDSELYCRSCYGRAFGPKGYGYGAGTGFLMTEGTTR